MSRLARVFMWMLLLAAIFIAVAYFLPREVYVERSAEIEASPKTVYSQIIDLHSWNYWSKWNQIDPDMQIEYKNNGVGVGAGYTWNSTNKDVGMGSVEILEVQKFDFIDVEMSFNDQGTASSSFTFTENENSTTVTWGLKYDVGNNPFARWMGLMMPKYVGNIFDAGLRKLNARCKLLETEKHYMVFLDDVEEFTFAGIRKKVSFVEVSLEMGKMYDEIGKFLAEKEVEMAGMPFAMYHLMSESEIDLECGFPTQTLVEGNDNIIGNTFPKTKCASVDFYGDYQNLSEGHTAIQKWIENHGFQLAGAPMEFYLNDPEEEPNPENWLTRIYYPVE